MVPDSLLQTPWGQSVVQSWYDNGGPYHPRCMVLCEWRSATELQQLAQELEVKVTIQGVTEECGFQALKILDWYGLSCFGLRSKG
ncbi:MAG: hypothetical protein ACO331_10455 [Prochlorothrix sp.]